MFHLVRMSKLSLFLILILFNTFARGFVVQSTSYDESHVKIVDSGFTEFKAHFRIGGDEEKNSLLFCLERYVDPYFEATIDYETELYDWLFVLLSSNESVTVKEHALDVLTWDSSREMHACEINTDGELDCCEE